MSPGRAGFPGLRTALVLLVALTLAACGDDAPSGPGVVDVRVVPPVSADAGAVVVELVGPGIEAVEPAGGARVFGAATPGRENTFRAVVAVDSGALVFRLRLADVAVLPRGSVVDAVDRQNLPLSGLTAFEVRLSR